MNAVTGLHVAVQTNLIPDLVEGEGRHHLDCDNGHILETQFLALGNKLEVDLPCAEDKPLDTRGISSDGRVALGDHPLELRARAHVLQPAHTAFVPQQGLGRGEDERLAEVALQLLSQGVKVVGRRGEVHDLPIALLDLLAAAHLGVVGHVVLVVIAELQIALEPAGGVLGALAVVAVRQEHRQGGLLQPLVLACADELVKDDLRCVGKVAKLRLPNGE
mmetsp:Transcript_83305/g.269468  ORF Transcript_83305/g.269468 Transcript_83305/m.269468 type:complete len:219 (+) Transcript_83305:364-1020(+)